MIPTHDLETNAALATRYNDVGLSSFDTGFGHRAVAQSRQTEGRSAGGGDGD